MRKPIYGRSYGFGDKFTGKWAQDRPGCERFRVVVICEGEERGKIVGKIIAQTRAKYRLILENVDGKARGVSYRIHR